jgi:aspartate ammonia-lyase
MPVVAHNILFSMQILTSAIIALEERCVRGIEANEPQCAFWVERSAALATALAPRIGYAKAAELSKESVKSGELIRHLAEREQVLPPEELAAALDLRRMTEIGVPGAERSGL